MSSSSEGVMFVQHGADVTKLIFCHPAKPKVVRHAADMS
jgi:hypothetical protein